MTVESYEQRFASKKREVLKTLPKLSRPNLREILVLLSTGALVQAATIREMQKRLDAVEDLLTR